MTIDENCYWQIADDYWFRVFWKNGRIFKGNFPLRTDAISQK